MAGPTAAESLIKAAAAGEGARKGGGARRKGWKEVGGSTRPRPPTQSGSRRSQAGLGCRTRRPGWTRVRARWIWVLLSVLFVAEEERAASRKSILRPTPLSLALEASSLALPPGLPALASWRPSLGPLHTPSSAHLSVSQRGSNIPAEK